MITVIPYNRALPEIPGRTSYSRPDARLEKLGAGNYAVRQGCRPSTMFLVGKLRAAVDRWCDDGCPGISDITRHLFQFSFDEDHLLTDGATGRYWWVQQEAIETLVYLADFAPLADKVSDRPMLGMLPLEFTIDIRSDGQRILRRWASEVEGDASEQGMPPCTRSGQGWVPASQVRQALKEAA